MALKTQIKNNTRIELFTEAKKYFPGGVNSPVRSFNSVGGTPLFASSGSGPLLRDTQGYDYIDLCCSWGALPLGHSDPRVQLALSPTVAAGLELWSANRRRDAASRTVTALVATVAAIALCQLWHGGLHECPALSAGLYWA